MATNYRYIRTSTSSQSNLRQLAKQHPNEILIIDCISGSTAFKDRPEASKLLKVLEAGDTVSVSSVDRMGRSALDCKITLDLLSHKGVIVKVDNLGIQSLVNGKPNQVFNLIVDVLNNISEMELSTLKERIRDGIAQKRAVNKDAYAGRKKGTGETPEQFLAKHKRIIKVLKKHPNESLRDLAKLAADEEKKYHPSANTVKKVKAVLAGEKNE